MRWLMLAEHVPVQVYSHSDGNRSQWGASLVFCNTLISDVSHLTTLLSPWRQTAAVYKICFEWWGTPIAFYAGVQ